MQLSVYSACTPTLTAQELMRAAKLAGYAGIEWRIGEPSDSAKPPHFLHNNFCSVADDNDSIDRACEQTKALGLQVTTLSPYIAPGDVKTLSYYYAAALRNEVPVVRLRASWMSHSGYQHLAQSDREFFRFAADLAKGTPVTFAVETHQRSIAPSASLALRLIDGLDPDGIGVIYDIGNLAVEGYENPRIALEILSPYLLGVHLKNGHYERSHAQYKKWEFTWSPLDDGLLDLPAYLGLLSEFNYTGWVTVEDFSSKTSDAQKLHDAATYLTGASKELRTNHDLQEMRKH